MLQTRMTKQRAIILETVRQSTSHPTADDIYNIVRKKMPRISLGTVYRNLEMLTSSGDIRCLEKAGSQRRFDGNMTPHHHIRCKVCGKVGDIFDPIETPDVPQGLLKEYEINSVEIEFIGICLDCQQNNPVA